MNIRKTVGFILGLSLSITASGVPVHADESEDFQKFMNDQFVEAMEDDYTTMHFTVKDYASYGIEKPDVNIGEADWDDYASDKEDAEDALKKLHQFDYDSLSDEEKTDYDTLEFSLQNTIDINSYPYFDFLFSREEGVLDNIVTSLTEFVFYQKEDIDDYLKVVDSVDDYLDDCIDITEKQAEKGYFLNNDQLKNTEEYIDDFVDKKDDSQLITIFNKNVEAFDGLSQDEINNYEAENKDLVLNQVIPAYQKVEDTLEKLKGSRDKNSDYSVYSLKDGPAYYAALARYKTSMNTDVQTMFNVCDDFLQRNIPDFYQVMQTEDYEETLDFDNADDVLQYLQDHIGEVMPEGPEVTYTASYLDPSVANGSIVAYYMEPPIDDMKDNVIKINGDNISDTNELYETLAHEGFPGHLYQTTYFLNTNPPAVRSALSMMGYQEGWGMYAEMQAFDIADMNADAKAYNQLNTSINYVLDAAADLGVNGLGWSKNDLEDYLNQIGLNSSAADDLYDFVVSEPGTLLPYGVGLAEFMTLQSKAKNIQKTKFDMKSFNKVLLDNGGRPFESVEKDVDNYLGVTDDTAQKFNGGKVTEKENSSSDHRLLYGIVGGCAVVGIIALILAYRYRKDDPFRS